MMSFSNTAEVRRGYSSMSSPCPSDQKIDRSLVEVSRVNRRSQYGAISPGPGRLLGVEVAAQGVEKKADLQVLRQLGYAAMQGYYFAPTRQPSNGHPIQVGCSLTEGVGVRKQVRPATLRGIDDLGHRRLRSGLAQRRIIDCIAIACVNDPCLIHIPCSG